MHITVFMFKGVALLCRPAGHNQCICRLPQGYSNWRLAEAVSDCYHANPIGYCFAMRDLSIHGFTSVVGAWWPVQLKRALDFRMSRVSRYTAETLK